MSDLATWFTDAVEEGTVSATPEAWQAFQIGALYAGCFIIDAIDRAEGQSARVQLACVVSALKCLDLDTDIPCACPVQTVV